MSNEEIEGMVMAYIEDMCERGDGEAKRIREILLEEWT